MLETVGKRVVWFKHWFNMEHRTSPAPSLQAPVSSSQDTLRLQHLYTLAFADRMRLLQPFSPFPPLLTPPMIPRFAPPPDLAMFPMAKLDPRLFRIPFPEEPKPQHSYIGLIAMSILSSVEKKLVLADIYQYILDNFPYFRHRGPGWRNSIRHNLSLNDCFIKAGRASNGKGHYWAVHPACQQDFQKGDFSRRKAQKRVRRYLGMNLSLEEDDQTPPSSPTNVLDILPAELEDSDVDIEEKVGEEQQTWYIKPNLATSPSMVPGVNILSSPDLKPILETDILAIKPETRNEILRTNFSIAQLLRP